MNITGAATTAAQHQYTGPAKLAADNDGDGRKGAAALNDGDAAARRANQAIARAGQSTGQTAKATPRSVDVKA